ncbi:MAG: hypothetical protein WEC41_01685, partial [Dongiaceae bacterium]
MMVESPDKPHRRALLLTWLVSALWLAVAAAYVEREIGWRAVLPLPPHEQAAIAAGVLLPLILLWLIVVVALRGQSVRRHLGELRDRLDQMTVPAADAEARAAAVTQALRRETNELRTVKDEAASVLDAAR